MKKKDAVDKFVRAVEEARGAFALIRLKKKRTLYTLIASLAASPLIFYLAVEINQLLLLILAALVL
ncbi:MAG: hypothetical protein K6347_06145, partial [Campylobacterales bacterium]